jgi:hypothetical protein
MKGPSGRLQTDCRRLWKCPACGAERRLSGVITSALCHCGGTGQSHSTRWMVLQEPQLRVLRPVVEFDPHAPRGPQFTEDAEPGRISQPGVVQPRTVPKGHKTPYQRPDSRPAGGSPADNTAADSPSANVEAPRLTADLPPTSNNDRATERIGDRGDSRGRNPRPERPSRQQPRPAAGGPRESHPRGGRPAADSLPGRQSDSQAAHASILEPGVSGGSVDPLPSMPPDVPAPVDIRATTDTRAAAPVATPARRPSRDSSPAQRGPTGNRVGNRPESLPEDDFAAGLEVEAAAPLERSPAGRPESVARPTSQGLMAAGTNAEGSTSSAHAPPVAPPQRSEKPPAKPKPQNDVSASDEPFGEGLLS